MLRLLEAELKYSKLFFVIVYTLLAVNILLFIFLGGRQAAAFNIRKVIPMAAIASIIYKSIRPDSEKRERLHALLPLTARQRGMGRLLFVIAFWPSLVLVFLIVTFIIRADVISRIVLWDMLSITGIVMLLNSIHLIVHDIKRSRPAGMRRNICTLALVLALIVLYGSVSMSSEAFQIFHIEGYPFSFFVSAAGVFLSPAGSLVIILCGMAVSVISIYTFKHRKSYLR